MGDAARLGPLQARLPLPDSTVHGVGRNMTRLPGRMQLDLLKGCGLLPGTDLLEIGCGIGRLVYELADYLSEGSYAGFDISSAAIDWLNARYVPVLPNFRFDLVDATNARYRPEGGGDPTAIRFPYDDKSFDAACSFSVFTHMQLHEVAHYLRELRRVLRPNGAGMMTFFAMTPDDVDPCLAQDRQFVQIADGTYSIDPEVPERAIAYDDELLRATASDAGLAIVDIVRGHWHSFAVPKDRPRVHKDVFILTPA